MSKLDDSEKQDLSRFGKDSSIDHGPTNFVVRADDRYHFDAADLDRVQRRLKQRHVQMYVPPHLYHRIYCKALTLRLGSLLVHLLLSRLCPSNSCPDCWYNRNWSLPRFRQSPQWCRPARCANRLRPRWNCRILVRYPLHAVA